MNISTNEMLTKNSILMIFCIICYGTYNEGRTAYRQYLVPMPWTVCLQGGLWQTDGQTQRQTHMVVCIHDDKQNGWVQSSHEAEQRAETVAVNWRAVVEMPQAAFCTCRQVTHQLYTHGGVIYSTRVNRGHRRSDCSHTRGVIYSTWVNRGHHRSDCSTHGGSYIQRKSSGAITDLTGLLCAPDFTEAREASVSGISWTICKSMKSN